MTISDAEALRLAEELDTAGMATRARELRDLGHAGVVSCSRKVFIPLTRLCRDVCHYCTFATVPRKLREPYLSIDKVLAICEQGAEQGCQEALFTLGERPELRYRAAREALAEMGFASTLDYLAHAAGAVLRETGLLPHVNAGNMNAAEIAMLRPVSASMGIMLESASPRLCQAGMPHYGSPDKAPELRLETMELAGQARVPFTTGILIGIGETRRERIESLLAIRAAHDRHGHIQEVIIQNFRAKPDTKMAQAPEPGLEELVWTIAAARLVFGPEMNIQAPPNLSPGALEQLVDAGINDWGGISPLTPDHVNPEAPWPHLDELAAQTRKAGGFLEQRLTIYPEYVREAEVWLDPKVRPAVLRHSDAEGFARRDHWQSGQAGKLPPLELALLGERPKPGAVSADIGNIVEQAALGRELSANQIVRLFQARGADFSHVVRGADRLRQETRSDDVSYVVNRNINYTNVCYFRCQFCAFSKGRASENLRGRPYDISAAELARRAAEAWRRGASEVCMQGGIHPDYTGRTYLDILETVRAAAPDIHIHAFSPLEIRQGAATLGVSLKTFLQSLRQTGLGTLPGTAAEILHDDIRQLICADKLNTAQWLEVMATAHEIGLRSTATILFGHVEGPEHWAAHLLAVRNLQAATGGFTEFVPLPYVASEAPMYRKGRSRAGPSFREALLMHAVPRLVLHGLIDNIQASWVKLGRDGALRALAAGANDLGGSLMNESITRAAGAGHGEEWPPAAIEAAIRGIGRQPRMRTTLYADADPRQAQSAFTAPELAAVGLDSAARRQRPKGLDEGGYLSGAALGAGQAWRAASGRGPGTVNLAATNAMSHGSES